MHLKPNRSIAEAGIGLIMGHDEKQLYQRIEKLEELSAHQSLSLDEISGELVRLKKEHLDLARRHKALVARLEAFEEAAEADGLPHHEKPPHY